MAPPSEATTEPPLSSPPTGFLPISESLRELRLCDLPPVSSLCVLHGVLAMLDGQDLCHQVTVGRSFLVDTVAVELLRLTATGLAETNTKLMGSRVLVLWTTKAWCVKGSRPTSKLCVVMDTNLCVS